MENQYPRVPILWEHSISDLLGHDSTSDPGIALRQWVQFQGVHNILDLLSREEEELKAVPAQQIYFLDDHGQRSYLRINQVKQICGLITYMKHVFREYNSGISWDQEELKAVPAQQIYSLENHGQGLDLRTNEIKQMYGLITYMKHVFGA